MHNLKPETVSVPSGPFFFAGTLKGGQVNTPRHSFCLEVHHNQDIKMSLTRSASFEFVDDKQLHFKPGTPPTNIHQLVGIGAFNWFNNTSHYVQLGNGQQVRVEKLDDILARVYVVENQGEHIKIPAGLVVQNTKNMQLPKTGQAYVIDFEEERYDLIFNGQLFMRLQYQRTHAISIPKNVIAGELNP